MGSSRAKNAYSNIFLFARLTPELCYLKDDTWNAHSKKDDLGIFFEQFNGGEWK
jgi:hypothetical protein